MFRITIHKAGCFLIAILIYSFSLHAGQKPAPFLAQSKVDSVKTELKALMKDSMLQNQIESAVSEAAILQMKIDSLMALARNPKIKAQAQELIKSSYARAIAARDSVLANLPQHADTATDNAYVRDLQQKVEKRKAELEAKMR